jgi:hypothetical protein
MTISSGAAIAERYEALRSAVLTHRASDERRGLALIVRDGMAAWIDAWAGCALVETTAVSVPLPDRRAIPSCGEVVSLLASMVLSTLQECPS